MSDIPGFIAIETGDDEGLPLAIAWSRPDGSIKHTLIQPDDSWINDESNVMGEYSIEELESLGVSRSTLSASWRTTTSARRSTPTTAAKMNAP